MMLEHTLYTLYTLYKRITFGIEKCLELDRFAFLSNTLYFRTGAFSAI